MLYEPTKVILRIYVLEIIVHLLLCDPATVQFMPLNHRLIAYDASQQQSHEFVLRCNIIIAFIVITGTEQHDQLIFLFLSTRY